MAKKSSTKQQARSSKPRVTDEDRARYGEVVDVFRTPFTEYDLGVAADVWNWDKARKALALVSILSLAGILYGLMPGVKDKLLVGVSFVIAMVTAVVSGKWNDIMKWRLRRGNLGQILADGEQRVVVCKDALHIEHGSTVDDLPLSSISNVAADDEITIVAFPNNNAVYIPCEALGKNRYKAIVDLLKA